MMQKHKPCKYYTLQVLTLALSMLSDVIHCICWHAHKMNLLIRRMSLQQTGFIAYVAKRILAFLRDFN